MSDAVHVGPPRAGFAGSFTVPGDKSIGHRGLLFGALAEGRTTVTHFSGGADVRASLAAIQALGARATWTGDTVVVEGAGLDLGRAGPVTIDCANSGTTMRLVAGLVAGRPGAVTLDGDASLRRRPMERVAEPLRRMGASIETTDGHAPLTVRGARLTGIDHALRVASAQVKSAVLLAGLRAEGVTRVREPLRSRDHTERLLRAMGAAIAVGTDGVAVTGGRPLRGLAVPLPGDPSSAAFLVVAALLVPGAELRLRGVGTNPTRTGALDILARMGAVVERSAPADIAGEPRADLIVRAGRLRGTTIAPGDVPAAIDELPILAVAAAFAEGETRCTGAEELRVKESDRLAALEQLAALGADVSVARDGFVIRGTGGRPLRGGRIQAHDDHRIAMAFAVAGLGCTDGVTIDGAGCVDVSWPGFFALLRAAGAAVVGEDACTT